MNTRIKELRAAIAQMEVEAGELSPATENYFENLYGILIVSYNALKDLNVLYQDKVPLVESSDSQAALRDAEYTVIKLTEEVRVLTHYKDGINLEVEQLHEESIDDNAVIKRLSAQLENTQGFLDRIEEVLKLRASN